MEDPVEVFCLVFSILFRAYILKQNHIKYSLSSFLFGNNYPPSFDLFKEIEMASSKFLISLRHLISGRCCIFFCFLLCFFFLFCERCRSEASAAPKTDPIEARAVNTMLGRWELTESSLWNISGELCSGAAIDNTDANEFNPAIKCDCNFQNVTICHITLFKVYAMDVTGAFPEELSSLTYLTNLGLGPNNFTGTLPAELGGLRNLQQWYMTSSGLSGELPTSLSNLTAMQTLDLSFNNITGNIPLSLFSLSSLTTPDVEPPKEHRANGPIGRADWIVALRLTIGDRDCRQHTPADWVSLGPALHPHRPDISGPTRQAGRCLIRRGEKMSNMHATPDDSGSSLNSEYIQNKALCVDSDLKRQSYFYCLENNCTQTQNFQIKPIPENAESKYVQNKALCVKNGAKTRELLIFEV
ncbi:hypothetical protein KFK09_021935 [Dendrobium nobile]|uniref:LRR receptor-like serine/threonine-protein kinase n=1 Tax=Dendrobium nobile TaxID=94219 RepID=A0A8T3AIP2_DENNO|nr:hypothetical protein KFK09_021935 [Dendrobium nobile]